MTPALVDELLTVADVAAKLRRSRRYVYDLLGSGRLQYLRDGDEYRIPVSYLAKYLQEQTRAHEQKRADAAEASGVVPVTRRRTRRGR